MRTIRDVNVKNKVILVRADFNVPMNDGKIVSDFRIRATVPTLEYLREHGAKKIIVISHLGRPEGRDRALSLKPVAERLNELISGVDFIDDVSGPDVEMAVKRLKSGGILVLENLRFYAGEKKNSRDFMQEIIDSVGAEIYVQDAFAVSHRAHASTDAVGDYLPVYAGLLLEKEVENLTAAVDNPARPLLVIIGGAKIEDKQPLIDKFATLADQVAVGGKIAADGFESKNPKIYVAEDFDEDADGVKLDAGPVATGKITGFIADAKTIVWNGLLGKAEDPAFATASTIVAEMMGEKDDAKTIICGGDTTGFTEGLTSEHPGLNYSLLSTGGGAALEFLLGHEMPGLKHCES